MRFNLLAIIPSFLFLFLVTGCIPSRTFVQTNQEVGISPINKEVTGRVVKIRFNDGNQVKGRNVKITSDSLFYTDSEKNKAVVLTSIKSVTVSPKISVSKIIGIPLFAAGIFGIATFDDRGGIEELGKIYGGASAIVLSGIILGVGNNIESETYYFTRDN